MISAPRETWRASWGLRSGGGNQTFQKFQFKMFNANFHKSQSESLFRIYDMDNDGYISNGELFQVEYHGLKIKLVHYKKSNIASHQMYKQTCM